MSQAPRIYTAPANSGDADPDARLNVLYADGVLPTPESITRNDLALRQIPIDWDAVKAFGRALNALRDEPITPFDIQQLKPKQEQMALLVELLPYFASVIAHRFDPRIPAVSPSAEKIEQLKPILKELKNFINRFSPKLAARFSLFVEQKADEIINHTAAKIFAVVDAICTIEVPQEFFVYELAKLYRNLIEEKVVEDEGLFSSDDERVLTIEEKVSDLLSESDPFDEYQLFSGLYRILIAVNGPINHSQADTAGVVASELMSGIEQFLRAQKAPHIKSAPKPMVGFEFSDESTWNFLSIKRSLAETFAPEKLAQVKKELPTILTAAKNALPKNGFAVADAIAHIAVMVLVCCKFDTPREKIVKALFSND